ncbi:MAG: glycosyltransferase family 2 protein [Novosphingobium sp.]
MVETAGSDHALCADERRAYRPYRSVVLHDAEDMVHPAALQAIDAALGSHDFVQLPVRPAEQPHSPWWPGHYADEFAESHAKAMVVRSAPWRGDPGRRGLRFCPGCADRAG